MALRFGNFQLHQVRDGTFALDDGKRKILVDDGMGVRWDEKLRARYGIDQGELDLDREFARAGLTRDDVTDVILTHLHFDHAGGTTRAEDGEASLSFPKATFHLQRRNWRWAQQPAEKDAGSFRAEDFALLEKSGRLHLLEGPTELYPGIELFVSEGHTVGLQLLFFEHDPEVAACTVREQDGEVVVDRVVEL